MVVSFLYKLIFLYNQTNIKLVMNERKMAEQDKYWGQRHQGGISSLSKQEVKSYIQFLKQSRNNNPDSEWLDSIKQFKQLVQSDPILRMNFYEGIEKSRQTLEGLKAYDIYSIMDQNCKKPPSYWSSPFVGFPLNAIFLEFMQNQNGRSFFADEAVNSAIKKILNDYGKMLQSPSSLKYLTEDEKQGWLSPKANSLIHNQWYKCDPELPNFGYKSWDQWFLRQFKDGMRLIGFQSPLGIDQTNIIINCCQSSPLENPIQPQFNVKITDDFWLKDNTYSLNDMFGGKKYQKSLLAKHFQGGVVYQAFLNPEDYHRWHSPVDGVIEDIYGIDGTYYFGQSQFIPFNNMYPNNCQPFLSAVATRKIIVIKAQNHKIGKIAIIFVGMVEVSSCVHSVQIGQQVKKGEQIGYFRFGGSSHVMIFEKRANLRFKQLSKMYQLNKESGQLKSRKQNLHSYLAHVLD